MPGFLKEPPHSFCALALPLFESRCQLWAAAATTLSNRQANIATAQHNLCVDTFQCSVPARRRFIFIHVFFRRLYLICFALPLLGSVSAPSSFPSAVVCAYHFIFWFAYSQISDDPDNFCVVYSMLFAARSTTRPLWGRSQWGFSAFAAICRCWPCDRCCWFKCVRLRWQFSRVGDCGVSGDLAEELVLSTLHTTLYISNVAHIWLVHMFVCVCVCVRWQQLYLSLCYGLFSTTTGSRSPLSVFLCVFKEHHIHIHTRWP